MVICQHKLILGGLNLGVIEMLLLRLRGQKLDEATFENGGLEYH